MAKVSAGRVRENVWGWCLASPLVIGLLVFTFYPLIMSITYSFCDYNLIKLSNFGLQNYKSIFGGMYTKDFLHALKITFIYSIVSVPLGMILGYGLAMFLCMKVKGNQFLLVLYYIPTLIPAVVSGSVWNDMFNETYGIFNNILVNYWGLNPIHFTDQQHLMASFLWISTFQVGGGSVIWVAGIKSVDKTYYEAALLDGASSFKMWSKITLPMTTPYIFYNLITGIIGALQFFTDAYILTGGSGGAGDALLSLNILIYNTAFKGWEFGVASAMSWVLCAIIGGVTVLLFLTKKWVYYADEQA